MVGATMPRSFPSRACLVLRHKNDCSQRNFVTPAGDRSDAVCPGDRPLGGRLRPRPSTTRSRRGLFHFWWCLTRRRRLRRKGAGSLSHLHMRPCPAPSGLDVALVELLRNRVIVQNFRLTEVPARDSAIAMAPTETARIARPALSA
jgi:hypothetical protein